MTDFETPCYAENGVTIPGCWPVVLSGDDGACICDGSPNAIAMDRRWRAWQRLQRMREHRAQREGQEIGLRVLPGVTDVKPNTRPIWRVPLRVVGRNG